MKRKEGLGQYDEKRNEAKKAWNLFKAEPPSLKIIYWIRWSLVSVFLCPEEKRKEEERRGEEREEKREKNRRREQEKGTGAWMRALKEQKPSDKLMAEIGGRGPIDRRKSLKGQKASIGHMTNPPLFKLITEAVDGKALSLSEVLWEHQGAFVASSQKIFQGVPHLFREP